MTKAQAAEWLAAKDLRVEVVEQLIKFVTTLAMRGDLVPLQQLQQAITTQSDNYYRDLRGAE